MLPQAFIKHVFFMGDTWVFMDLMDLQGFYEDSDSEGTNQMAVFVTRMI